MAISLSKGSVKRYELWFSIDSIHDWLNINLINSYTNHSLYITHLVKGSPLSSTPSVKDSSNHFSGKGIYKSYNSVLLVLPSASVWLLYIMAWSPTLAYIELVSERQCDNRVKMMSSEAHVREVSDVVNSEQCGWEQSQIKDDEACIWYSTFNKTQLGFFIIIWFR